MSFKRKILNAFLITGTLSPISGYSQVADFLSAGTQLCDETPYKLIFSDDFNGQALDNSKWHTYDPCKTPSWCTGGSDDWGDSRMDPKGAPNVIFRDANVVVDGGTCKLKVKFEPGSWKCGSCSGSPRTANLSSGMLATNYTKYFNSGKFEVRLKMPNFNRAHSTFWLWPGPGTGDKNEIDIAEAYGDPYWPSRFPGDNNRYCNYSTHTYNPSHEENRNRYPNQQWIDMVKGRYFKQQDWHTYACEWDHNRIKFFIDGNHVNTSYKYYNQVIWPRPGGGWYRPYYITRRPLECSVPASGYYPIAYGFPADNHSNSVLKITPYADASYSVPPGFPSPILSGKVLGEMELDYVKIWQRHPEEDNNAICDPANTFFSGTEVICGPIATFNLTGSVPGGVFSVNNGLVILGSTPTSVTVQRDMSSSNDWALISYTYSLPGCGTTYTVHKKVDLGTPRKPYVAVAKVRAPAVPLSNYILSAYKDPMPRSLIAYNYEAATSFEWDIYYGPGMAHHYKAKGQTVITPFSFNSSSGISWTLKSTNACGSTISSGTQSTFLKTTNQDTLVDYFTADVTDTAAYEQAVADRVAQQFVIDTTDSVAINTMIDLIRFEELGPYIIYSDTDTIITNNQKVMSTGTKLYPNPATQLLNIELGNDFAANLPVEVKITDIYGKTVQTFSVQGQLAFPVDLKGLPVNLYVIELVQNGRRERHKFSKI